MQKCEISIILSHSLGLSVDEIQREKIANSFDQDQSRTTDLFEASSTQDYLQTIDKEVRC